MKDIGQLTCSRWYNGNLHGRLSTALTVQYNGDIIGIDKYTNLLCFIIIFVIIFIFAYIKKYRDIFTKW